MTLTVRDESDLAAHSVRLKAEHPDWSQIRIAKEIGVEDWTKDKVRHALEHAGRRTSLPAVAAPSSIFRYEAARQALAEAVAVDEVKAIHDKAEAMRIYARMAGDIEMEQNAAELRIRAKARFGEIEHHMRVDGKLRAGRPRKNNGSENEPITPATISLKELGVTKKFSSEAQHLASISERALQDMIDRVRRQVDHRGHKITPNTEEKKERRDVRERDLGARQCALPTQKFGVILADPEWRFEPWSRATGMDRAADNHYPTSVTEVIAARDVLSIAADDAILWLWATAPMLPQALLVMGEWGFDYRSHFIWAKDRIGTGYWNRNKHELLLLGVRGKIPAPAMGTQWESVIEAQVGEHSAKPEKFLELIEFYFPTLPKIELNRRGLARPGWHAWGNEAEPPHDPETGEIIEAAE